MDRLMEGAVGMRIPMLVGLLAALAAGSGGDAQQRCATGEVLCEGECVEPRTDPDHCGSCDSACGTNESCVDGNCEGPGCQTGLVDCDGACVDPGSDPDHCGGCGSACSDGVDCVDGTCDDPCGGGEELCDGSCVDKRGDPDHCGGCGQACHPGEMCIDSDCVTLPVLPAERRAEPIVLSGVELPGLAGSPVDEVFVFSYEAGAGWQQVAHQVDERVE